MTDTLRQLVPLAAKLAADLSFEEAQRVRGHGQHRGLPSSSSSSASSSSLSSSSQNQRKQSIESIIDGALRSSMATTPAEVGGWAVGWGWCG